MSTTILVLPRRALAVLAVVTAMLGLSLTAAPATAAERAWAPAASATIHPGVQMYTDGAQCTANFVFDDAGGNVYLGYAAHCAGLGGATDTNGCENDSLPLGTKVTFNEGGSLLTNGTQVGLGTLVYSSWRTMRAIGTRNSNACAANDFALVRVHQADVGKVNPTVPFFGGPTGLGNGAATGSQVHSYGQSSLRPTSVLSPKTGLSLGSTHAGWGLDVYTATPGIPGDSGSGFINEKGRAIGTLSTVAIAPLAGSNGLGNLTRELAFARQHSGIDGLRLVKGGVFTPVP